MRFMIHLLIPLIVLGHAAKAQEPIVVLKYSSQRIDGVSGAKDPNNPFLVDKNYRQSHKVEKNVTLGHIMHAYYGGSGLNMKFVEMAIVQLNSHAFVRQNPHFLYAEKTLRLPSVNEIQSLLMGKKLGDHEQNTTNGRRNEIFFFGS